MLLPVLVCLLVRLIIVLMLWNIIVCDWCCVTGSQDVLWLFDLLGSWYYRTNVCVTGVASLSQDVMRLILWFMLYRTILYVTDVMSPKPWCCFACYLSLSSCEFINTSSHMCGSWYLPIFLLRNGSLTLVKMASLMDLANFWSSLPTVLMLLIDISWPMALWWSWMGDGAFMCSLYLSANVLPDSLMYSSS